MKKTVEKKFCLNHLSLKGFNVALFYELGFISKLELALLDPYYSKYDKYLPDVFYSFEDEEEQSDLASRVEGLEDHSCLSKFDVMLGGDILESFAIALELKKIEMQHETAAENHLIDDSNRFKTLAEMLLPFYDEKGHICSANVEEQILTLSYICYNLFDKEWSSNVEEKRQFFKESLLKALSGVPETIYRSNKEDVNTSIHNVVDNIPDFLNKPKLSEFEELLLERENKRNYHIRKNSYKLIRFVDQYFDKKKQSLAEEELENRMVHLMALTDAVILYSPYLRLDEKIELSDRLDKFCLDKQKEKKLLPKLSIENRNLRLYLYKKEREREE